MNQTFLPLRITLPETKGVNIKQLNNQQFNEDRFSKTAVAIHSFASMNSQMNPNESEDQYSDEIRYLKSLKAHQNHALCKLVAKQLCQIGNHNKQAQESAKGAWKIVQVSVVEEGPISICLQWWEFTSSKSFQSLKDENIPAEMDAKAKTPSVELLILLTKSYPISPPQIYLLSDTAQLIGQNEGFQGDTSWHLWRKTNTFQGYSTSSVETEQKGNNTTNNAHPIIGQWNYGHTILDAVEKYLHFWRHKTIKCKLNSSLKHQKTKKNNQSTQTLSNINGHHHIGSCLPYSILKRMTCSQMHIGFKVSSQGTSPIILVVAARHLLLYRLAVTKAVSLRDLDSPTMIPSFGIDQLCRLELVASFESLASLIIHRTSNSELLTIQFKHKNVLQLRVFRRQRFLSSLLKQCRFSEVFADMVIEVGSIGLTMSSTKDGYTDSSLANAMSQRRQSSKGYSNQGDTIPQLQQQLRLHTFISSQETQLKHRFSAESIERCNGAYRKAIEYYSEHFKPYVQAYLMKVAHLFQRNDVIVVMSYEDRCKSSKSQKKSKNGIDQIKK